MCGLSAGSTITPNYVDNSTSRVAPWCSCSASGSQREECDNFLDYFTNNNCLSECPSIHKALECTDSGFCGSEVVSVLSNWCQETVDLFCFLVPVFFQATFSSVPSYESFFKKNKGTAVRSLNVIKLCFKLTSVKPHGTSNIIRLQQ